MIINIRFFRGLRFSKWRAQKTIRSPYAKFTVSYCKDTTDFLQKYQKKPQSYFVLLFLVLMCHIRKMGTPQNDTLAVFHLIISKVNERQWTLSDVLRKATVTFFQCVFLRLIHYNMLVSKNILREMMLCYNHKVPYAWIFHTIFRHAIDQWHNRIGMFFSCVYSQTEQAHFVFTLHSELSLCDVNVNIISILYYLTCKTDENVLDRCKFCDRERSLCVRINIPVAIRKTRLISRLRSTLTSSLIMFYLYVIKVFKRQIFL